MQFAENRSPTIGFTCGVCHRVAKVACLVLHSDQAPWTAGLEPSPGLPLPREVVHDFLDPLAPGCEEQNLYVGRARPLLKTEEKIEHINLPFL